MNDFKKNSETLTYSVFKLAYTAEGLLASITETLTYSVFKFHTPSLLDISDV